MHRLVAFLLKRYTLILFLILEVVAVTIVISQNNYHRNAYRRGISDFAGATYKVWSNVTGYFSLKKENRILAEENADLHNRLKSSFRTSDKRIFVWRDTLYQQQFQYVSSQIVNSSINKKKNYIVIDKGSNQGIENDMGVIASSGIVGMVKTVSRNFSLIIPVINIDASIAARLKSNDQKGIVRWDGQHYSHGVMSGIPGHVDINKGDTIITSGQSLFFPEGIVVGFVSDFSKNRSDNFYTVQLDFAVDFNSLNYVYVIRNLMAEEQIRLLKMIENEQ